MRRDDICLYLSPANRSALDAIIKNRNSSSKAVWRGTFRSVAELEAAIDDYLLRHNATAKPYVWTKSASDILASGSHRLI